MTLVLDSRQVPAADRTTAVRELIASTIVPVDIAFPASGPQVRGAITDLGALRVCGIRSNAAKVERTARLARDSMEPSIFLGLQTQGSSLIVQDGREAVLEPGELVLYRSTAPYTLVDGGGITQFQFRVPIEELAIPHDALRQVSAVAMSPRDPIADLAVAYFGRIAADAASFEGPNAEAVGDPAIALLRALVATHLDQPVLLRDAANETLSIRILEYIRLHLTEPDLNAARIARAHSISVRHLYNVLSVAGISLGDHIRSARLEGCHHELAGPGAGHVHEVACRWGFRDPSTFGRQFRAAYGYSPSEWRALNEAGRR